MKFNSNNHLKYCSIAFIIAMIVVDCSFIIPQEKNPPAPKKPVSELKMPEPIRSQEIKGLASIPEGIKIGYALDLSNMILMGNWNIQGKVAAINHEKISFVTEKDEKGNFVYRLPEKFELSINSGESIDINRLLIGFEASLGFQLLIQSKNNIILGAGRINDKSPQIIKVTNGITLQQSKEQGKVLSESDFETIYDVPITLITDGRSTELKQGKAQDIKLGEKTLRILVYQSQEIIPSEKYEGVSEGSGYILEYVVITK